MKISHYVSVIVASLALVVSVAHADTVSISNTLNTDLTLGSRGSDVAALQTFLIASGYDIAAVSSGATPKGYFGTQTAQAVQRYQSAHGIPATGYVGAMTRAAVNGAAPVVVNPGGPMIPGQPTYPTQPSYPGGTYPTQPTYPNNNGASPLRLLSPNGGERLVRGSSFQITWSAPYYFRATSADIVLQRQMACTTQVCPMIAYAPITIASNLPINQNSYTWIVGNAGLNVGDGTYTMQICETNTSNCDSSDSSFTIGSSGSTQPTGQAPVISGIDSPTSVGVNQTATWTIRASDPSNSTLSYAVDWGDTIALPSVASANIPPVYNQTTTFSHSYSTPGIRTITFTVKNIYGLTARTTTTVNVGNSGTGAGPLRIVTPNGGEQLTKGSQYQITWTSPYYFKATTAELKLINVPCTDTSRPCTLMALAPYTITTGININANVYSWTVGNVQTYSGTVQGASNISSLTTVVPDGNYKIQICEVGTSNCEQSDTYFTIRSSGGGTNPGTGPLRVITPNGGETLTKGTSFQISWTAPQYFAPTYATISLMPSNSCPSGQYCTAVYYYPYTLASNVPINQGVLNWIVGNVQPSTSNSLQSVPDGTYTIMICVAGTNTCDSSDGLFTITSNSTASLPDINVISPNGGESFGLNQPLTVSYNVTGNLPQGGSYGNMVYLNFVNENNTSTNSAVKTNVQNGTQTSTVTASVPGRMKIYAELRNSQGQMIAYDYSDGYFNIVPAVSNSSSSLWGSTPCPAGYTCSPIGY